MKRLLIIALVGMLIPLTGCINLSFGSHRKAPPVPPSAPAIVMPSVPVTSPEAATLAEIDAAGRLNFEASKMESLKAIAQRPGLTPTVQVHLVNVAYRKLGFEHSKVEVLKALIANPVFCDAGRHAIVTQLDHLGFDQNRQAILRQLNQRVSSSS